MNVNYRGLSERDPVLHHHRMTITFRAVIAAALATAARIQRVPHDSPATGTRTSPMDRPRARVRGMAADGVRALRRADSGPGLIRRRTGETMLAVARSRGRATPFARERRHQSMKPRGRRHAHRRHAHRWQAVREAHRLVRRATPFVVEKNYPLWPGAVSDSQYAVTEDTAVFMTTRDGARLVSYIARPVGKGPFGVVLQRTPTPAFSVRRDATGHRAATSSSRSMCAAETSPTARFRRL